MSQESQPELPPSYRRRALVGLDAPIAKAKQDRAERLRTVGRLAAAEKGTGLRRAEHRLALPRGAGAGSPPATGLPAEVRGRDPCRGANPGASASEAASSSSARSTRRAGRGPGCATASCSPSRRSPAGTAARSRSRSSAAWRARAGPSRRAACGGPLGRRARGRSGRAHGRDCRMRQRAGAAAPHRASAPRLSGAGMRASRVRAAPRGRLPSPAGPVARGTTGAGSPGAPGVHRPGGPPPGDVDRHVWVEGARGSRAGAVPAGAGAAPGAGGWGRGRAVAGGPLGLAGVGARESVLDSLVNHRMMRAGVRWPALCTRAGATGGAPGLAAVEAGAPGRDAGPRRPRAGRRELAVGRALDRGDYRWANAASTGSRRRAPRRPARRPPARSAPPG